MISSAPAPATPAELAGMNVASFCADIERLKADAYRQIGPADFAHLRKIERYGRIAAILGLATAWTIPNPVTAFLLSLGQFTRWLLAHHITHRGYDRVPGIPARYTSRVFARGWRRYVDWFDWLDPDAWDHEHNILHHYHTGEESDPDLAERNLEFLRQMRAPLWVKYMLMALAACTWKIIYYAPNSLNVLDPITRRRLHHSRVVAFTIGSVFDFRRPTVRRLWATCYLPYATWHFVVIPLMFLPLGMTAVWCVLGNKLLAEAITNAHAFLVIAPNHTADDLYRFSFHYHHKDEFYVTQVVGSANYHCGNELTDYMSLWLNYQIEHHLIPDLPMRQYTRIQPQVRSLCERHGIPYRQESVFRRFGRMLDVAVGRTSMRELEAFPSQLAAGRGQLSERAHAEVDGASGDVADDALDDVGAVLGS
ncbi:MAG: fatty acid desaturase family protein [Planctomycetaceae bacterium]